MNRLARIELAIAACTDKRVLRILYKAWAQEVLSQFEALDAVVYGMASRGAAVKGAGSREVIASLLPLPVSEARHV